MIQWEVRMTTMISLRNWIEYLLIHTNPSTRFNVGRHLEISLPCISLTFSHLQLLGPTNMAANGFNFCGPHETGCLIHSGYRHQF